MLTSNRSGSRAARETEQVGGAAGRPIVCIGGSHTGAIAAAAQRLGDGDTRVINLISFRKPFVQPRLDADAPSRLHRAVIRAAGKDCGAVFSVVGGNTHNVMGLVRHPRPFDFVLPGEPELPLDPAAEIIPYDAMKAVIERRAGPIFHQLQALADQYKGRLTHVESPPPVRETASLEAPNLAREREKYGDASPMLRYRLWRLHTTVIRSFCERLDVRFLAVPPESMDGEGFLLPGLIRNATHGNAHYGAMVLAQMKAAIA